MMNRDVVKTSLGLIREKIIKTDTVLHIISERNAVISELNSKLDLVSAKFIEKCQALSTLKDQCESKEKQSYTLTSRLVRVQEQHDQLAFQSNFAQTQHNERNNENYLIIQNLEAELIKLNDLINKLKTENELLTENGSNVDYITNDLKLKATVKDLKKKIKIFDRDLKDEKRLHHIRLEELQASRKDCERFENIFNKFKNGSKREPTEKCLKCCENSALIIEPILYKSNSDVQKEKYNKLYSQFEELQLIVNKLKNENIQVAEKYSNLLLNGKESVKSIDVSSQTIKTIYLKDEEIDEDEIDEDEVFSSQKNVLKRIDADEKIVRIRQLKTEKLRLNEHIAKVVRENRILHTDYKYLQQVNNKIHDKYEELVLEKECWLLEYELKRNLVSIETQTSFENDFLNVHASETSPLKFEDKNHGLNRIIDENDDNCSRICDNIDDLGLTLSSDSESDKDCDDILEKMVKTRKIISPIPNTPKALHGKDISPLNQSKASNDNLDFRTGDKAHITIDTNLNSAVNDLSLVTSDSLNSLTSDSLNCLTSDSLNCQMRNTSPILAIHESTQTDFVLEDVSNLIKVDFACQTVSDISTEEKGMQCVLAEQEQGIKTDYISRKNAKTKMRYNREKFILHKVLKMINMKNRNYDMVLKNGKVMCYYKYKNNLKTNLEFALRVFRKYAITMSFKKGLLINLTSKSKIQTKAVNSFLFRKCRKFMDLKEALNCANRNKLSAVIINGIICDKKLIKNDIEEIEQDFKLKSTLDSADSLKGVPKKINSSILNTEKPVKKLNKNRPHRKTVSRKNDKNQEAQKTVKKTRSNELRNKFEMEGRKRLLAEEHVENESTLDIKKAKINTIDNKDNSSVDSGYTDGSVTSESSVKEIENVFPEKRVLRSSFKSTNKSCLSKTNSNKRRKISTEDLFGSDDSDSDNNCLKPPIKKRKVSVLDKMRKAVKLKKSKGTVLEPPKKSTAFKKKSQEADSEIKIKTHHSELPRLENDFKSDGLLLSVENEYELKMVKDVNKEHLLQRFISDIPIIKPIQKAVEKTVFRKPLTRNKAKLIHTTETIEEIVDKNNTDSSINQENSSNVVKGITDDEGTELLNTLIESNCEESIVFKVCERIKMASTKQISRLIIRRVYKFRGACAEPSHTPLAPSLSPTYKTLIGFAQILSETHEDIFTELLNQMEIKFILYKNLNKMKLVTHDHIQGVVKGKCSSIISLEQVFRFYVSVCMLRTEVLRLRRFICDMAFYQKNGWYALMYAVFSIWPSLLPKHFDENRKDVLRENDALLMKVLMFFVFKKRNTDEYMYYRPFLSTFAFGYYKYKSDSFHIKLIFDELVEKFTTSNSNIVAYSFVILMQRITNAEFINLLRSESFNNVFKCSDDEKLIAKSKLLWLLDKIIPEIKMRGDATVISTLQNIFEKLQTRVENGKVKEFIQSCIGKLTN